MVASESRRASSSAPFRAFREQTGMGTGSAIRPLLDESSRSERGGGGKHVTLAEKHHECQFLLQVRGVAGQNVADCAGAEQRDSDRRDRPVRRLRQQPPLG